MSARKRYRGDRRGKSAEGTPAPGSNIMEEFRIDFLSPVDRPAQQGARALLLKRDDSTGPPRTAALLKEETPGVMTGTTLGHSHIVWFYRRIGETTLQQAEGADSMHDHPFQLNDDGTVTIGENAGHTHTVSPNDVLSALLTLSKSDSKVQWPDPKVIKEEPVMSDPKPTQKSTESANADLQAEITALNERLALQGIVASMSDSERAHLSALPDDTAKRAFVSKSQTDRQAEIAEAKKAAEESDSVVYKSLDGDVYRKSDDPRAVNNAKRADEAVRRADAAEKRAEEAEYTKRAESELAHLPGTVTERIAILKAVDGIKDQGEREAALKALKASDSTIAKGFATFGTTDPRLPDENSPQGKLDLLVKRHMETEKVDEGTAYAKVLETPEGKRAYADLVNQ